MIFYPLETCQIFLMLKNAYSRNELFKYKNLVGKADIYVYIFFKKSGRLMFLVRTWVTCLPQSGPMIQVSKAIALLILQAPLSVIYCISLNSLIPIKLDPTYCAEVNFLIDTREEHYCVQIQAHI